MSLDIGLLGCGRWGRFIVRDLVSLNAQVHVVEPAPDARAFAIEIGAASAVETIADIPVPAAGYVVATPISTHAAEIQKLLPTGRPIFVEKPLADDVAQARHIVSAGGERVFVMDKWRYHPGIEAMARMARGGELGRVLAINSYRLGWGEAHADVEAIWTLLPHDLSIALEILGRLPAASVAWAPVPGGSDLTALLDDGEGGPRVTVQISSRHPLNRRSVVVVGERKTVQLADAYADKLVIMEGCPDEASSGPQEPKLDGAMPLLAELRAFLGHIQGGPAPRSLAAEGLLVVERIAALRWLAGLEA